LNDLQTLAGDPNKAVETGTGTNINFAPGVPATPASYTLCNANATGAPGIEAGNVNSPACARRKMGRVVYARLHFPTAGNYTLRVTHDDQVQVDMSSFYSSPNYHNALYDIPVGKLDSYTSDDNADGSSTASGTVSTLGTYTAQANSCALIRVYWNNTNGRSFLRLKWTRPGPVTEFIPAERLFDPSTSAPTTEPNACTTSITNTEPSITLNKTVAGRAIPADQFTVQIATAATGGTTLKQDTTSGSDTGAGQATASVLVTTPATYYLRDVMSNGRLAAYNTEISCQKNGAGTFNPTLTGTPGVWSAAMSGSDKLICTITNTPKPVGKLTVTKNLVGGPATHGAMDFPFSVTCQTPSGTYNGTVTVPANQSQGSVDVPIPVLSTNCQMTEGVRPAAPANYTWGPVTYDQPSQEAMTSGGSITGTIRNPLDPNPGKLIVTKHIAGGTSPASMAFPVTVTCTSGNQNGSVTVPANQASGQAVFSPIPAGATCSVSETGRANAPANHHWVEAELPSAGPTAAMPAGGQLELAITNTLALNSRTITVKKALSPTTDGGKFNLLINGAVQASNVGHDGSGAIAVAAGSQVSVGETGNNTSLDNYASQLSCGDVSVSGTGIGGTFTMPDKDVTCIFTNTRKTNTVKVIKALSPTDDGGKFNLLINNETKKANASHNDNTGDVAVPVGSTVSVSETAGEGTSLAHYTSALTCTGVTSVSGTTSGEFTMPDGAVTCTFTNTRKKIDVKITKTVTGAPAAGAPGDYGFKLTCGGVDYTGIVKLEGTATAGSTTVQVPEGVTCSTLAETSKAPAPANHGWKPETTTPPEGEIATGAQGSITNPLETSNLVVTKTNSASSVTKGATVTYTVTIVNNGPLAATGIQWDDTSTGLEVTAISPDIVSDGSVAGSCSTAPAPAGCTGITVAANGGSVRYKVTAKVTGDVGAHAVNTATVTGGSCGSTVDSQAPETRAAEPVDPCTSTDDDPIEAPPVVAVTPVPTMTEWGLMLLTALLTALAWLIHRRSLV
jgi:uncharacterized repeat protein (TIGR01451 family)